MELEGCLAISTTHFACTTSSPTLLLPPGRGDIVLELTIPPHPPTLTSASFGDRITLSLAPQSPPPAPSLFGFITLGASHIASGADHLLFIAGLFFLVGRTRKLALAITGFTIGHSLTLALIATHTLRIPAPLVEAWIALSLVFVALELARREAAPSARNLLVVASLFGIVHGAGFADGLQSLGAFGDALPRAVLGFNVGVELGQLAFVACLALAWSLASVRTQPFVRRASAYAIGIAGVFLLFDRIAAWRI